MSRICEICGKRPHVGNALDTRGLPKKKGGIGKKITGKTKRWFLPNIHSIRVEVNGSVRRMRVCTRCLKASKVKKAV